MNSIEVRIKSVKQRINAALTAADRQTDQVKLLCVSKYASLDAMQAAIQAGQTCFAENYLRDALTKMEVLQEYDLEWHFIGKIQRNKTRKIAENFAWVHSIDSEKVAQLLNGHRKNLLPLDVCI